MSVSIKRRNTSKSKTLYKSKSKSSSRKHLNKSRKCGSKTRKLRGGAGAPKTPKTPHYKADYSNGPNKSEFGPNSTLKRSVNSLHKTLPKPEMFGFSDEFTEKSLSSLPRKSKQPSTPPLTPEQQRIKKNTGTLLEPIMSY